ncbi:MAG: hypothetical protein QF486_01920 [Candidatus Woesearchaeota archaeon]|jgi:hypothetical protein|nr:hypothetical protein [Candidatus Woesearchaeota archaeon]MDP7181029.1 hypothetical protein [Candidatus Woesearchaeota archaeon]MDP7198350.1 hypothetical protein [Candidatus Woesearchaeota archaeon]MDP7467452.1 hypothetical protein [Candidatus Woesearchaeota archaeon]MDP7647679.1 hypothetical protein [Candidatus Woesearchaeota archaeon]|tara:strand:- start:368 stop:946 length:579 start_codon:yes stop_codon:yes gene_type:complete
MEDVYISWYFGCKLLDYYERGVAYNLEHRPAGFERTTSNMQSLLDAQEEQLSEFEDDNNLQHRSIMMYAVDVARTKKQEERASTLDLGEKAVGCDFCMERDASLNALKRYIPGVPEQELLRIQRRFPDYEIIVDAAGCEYGALFNRDLSWRCPGLTVVDTGVDQECDIIEACYSVSSCEVGFAVLVGTILGV